MNRQTLHKAISMAMESPGASRTIEEHGRPCRKSLLNTTACGPRTRPAGGSGNHE